MRAPVCFLALTLAGCTVGPNYKRPAVAVPDRYRGPAAPAASAAATAPATAPAGPAAPAPSAPTAPTTPAAPAPAAPALATAPTAPEASLADAKWPDVFPDETLKRLIATAIERNFDLALASERIEEARARYRIAGANQYPFVYAGAEVVGTQTSTIGSAVNPSSARPVAVAYTQVGAALSWELDLWGRIRRLKESARADYLATEEARRGVLVSLIGDVAGGYFTLREHDLELQIARGTRDIADRNLKLVSLRHDHGAATGLDVHQAEQFLYTAAAREASVERDIGQTENALSLLLGGLPGDIPRGQPIDGFALPPELPPGLPSSLIGRRPDIREAEQKLVSANAQIGAAMAYYFPQISLTGALGGQSRALSELFTAPARYWTLAPNALLPIFNAGQVRVAVRLTEAQKREMLIGYQKTIYTAFREVSDTLVRYDRTREQRAQEDRLVEALTETTRLATLRYQGGADSYLQVLNAESDLFQARLTQAQLRLQCLLAYVDFYRALGGGWQ